MSKYYTDKQALSLTGMEHL